MLSIALRSVLIALVASAVTVSAAPGLGLKLSGPNKVNGVDNLKIVATVINTGDEPLKLLNDPRGLLSKMPTQTFLVSHDESGAAPAFTGVKASFVLVARMPRLTSPAGQVCSVLRRQVWWR